MREGTIPFKRFETWYGIVGEGEEPGKLPVLTLHGGPGVTHDYLESMADLADGRRVIFYDQLGCGKSATPEIAGRVHRGIPGSEWIIFEQSSHLPHAEERELFMERVGAFLATVEAARGSQA
jgi:pimeloyl-ACP methyl ester carboxylesterase